MLKDSQQLWSLPKLRIALGILIIIEKYLFISIGVDRQGIDVSKRSRSWAYSISVMDTFAV